MRCFSGLVFFLSPGLYSLRFSGLAPAGGPIFPGWLAGTWRYDAGRRHLATELPHRAKISNKTSGTGHTALPMVDIIAPDHPLPAIKVSRPTVRLTLVTGRF